PIAKRTVADLVVVLEEIDKGRGRKLPARLAAWLVAPEARDFTLVDKAGAKRPRQIGARYLPRGGSCAASSRLARLSPFSSTRWICRPLAVASFPAVKLRSCSIEGMPGSDRIWLAASSLSPSKR